MDVKTRPAPPTDAERDAVASVLGAERPRGLHVARGGHLNKARRHLLLPTLHAVNDRVGWISMTAVDHIAERLDISPAEVYGVASFYALFALQPRDPHQVHICTDLACRANGGPNAAALPAGAHASPCLGLCERAPAALVIDAGDPAQRAVAGNVTPVEIASWAAGGRPGAEAGPAAAVPQPDESLVLLRRAGRVDPLDIAAFIADGGFAALERARELGPEGVIAAVTASGLVGRGGAAFPTGRKWDAVRTQPAFPHYLVCNADESEPGTFKDRVLIENDPFNIVEAMCIAAIATGSEHGYVYIRGEYPRPEATLEHAVAEARARGYLGNGFDITIVRGAGAYICGEETAIFNSIEGHRGEPRNKPPFPFEVGLFGKPTAVNNVETLANVPGIVLDGRTANRRLFCLSGAVAQPGVYEVELGLTLGQLIELAGGMRAGSELQAVLLGGAAGGFAGPNDLDLVLDHDSTRAAGLTLGSGVVMVHDQHVDLVDQLQQIAAFFRDESCGQCVPCRVGTVRQEEAIERLARSASDGDLSLLREIGQAMRDASICGLGQTAANAIESAIVRLGAFQR